METFTEVENNIIVSLTWEVTNFNNTIEIIPETQYQQSCYLKLSNTIGPEYTYTYYVHKQLVTH